MCSKKPGEYGWIKAHDAIAKATGLGYKEVVKWNIEQAAKVYAWRQSNK